MTVNEKLNKIKSIIEKSNLTGGKITIETVIKEMENATLFEVAELIVEMGNLIKDIKDILKLFKKGRNINDNFTNINIWIFTN